MRQSDETGVEKIIAERLLKLREELGISQRKAAEMAGLSQASLNRYELGIRSMSADALVKLACAYRVTTDYLVGLSDCKTENTSKFAKYIMRRFVYVD